MIKIIFLNVLLFFCLESSQASGSGLWDRDLTLSEGQNRENIYNLNDDALKKSIKRGYIHALKYPVSVSGLIIPYAPMVNFFNTDSKNPLKKLLLKISKKVVGFGSMTELYEWLGLNPFNPPTAKGVFKIPYPDGVYPDYYMGASLVKRDYGLGLTFSCATCHTSRIFGKTVMGLTNKRARANKMFHLAKKTVPFIPAGLFKIATRATKEEVREFKRLKRNIKSVGVIVPQVTGLDTSLPQVALSLARRNKDEYASKNPFYERFPRKNPLDHFVSDSKPAVWWNLKYKTRWLSDGSIVQGNPIFTNFLWNELGRGSDLKKLEKWMRENKQTIDDLTVAVFSTQAPHWTDFFPASSINVEMAKRGEKVFNNRCMKCHGIYAKGWSSEDADFLDPVELLKTTKVKYHKKTPVKDVGTDPQRYMGTKYFASKLNNLKISKWAKTIVEPQKGYVPPPLVGIWMRYPYLHNNSIPNLCAFLTRPEDRPKFFIQGPANDPRTDFTDECVGYPVGDDIPKEWRKDKEAYFDTTKPGLSNMGHSKAFIGKYGEELLSPQNKKDLIMYLKTL